MFYTIVILPGHLHIILFVINDNYTFWEFAFLYELSLNQIVYNKNKRRIANFFRAEEKFVDINTYLWFMFGNEKVQYWI